MPDYIRSLYTSGTPRLLAAVSPRLLSHRDEIYRRHLALPMDF